MAAAVAVATAVALSARGGGDEQRVAAPLPRAFCSQLLTAPGAKPGLLVVSDLPLRGPSHSEAMAAAAGDVVRARGFRAGRHRIAFQSCDDSTAAAGTFEVARCVANARAYVANPAVVGVVGPLHSRCAEHQLPILHRAGLALVSPANTRDLLTRPVTGRSFAEQLQPGAYRTYARVAPPDAEQGVVIARLAERLGIRRVFLLFQGDDYGVPLREGTRRALRAAGIEEAGTASWDAQGQRAERLAREVEASGADAVHLSGVWAEGGIAVVEAVRARLGRRVRLLLTDGFARMPPREAQIAEGAWMTVPGLAPDNLPPAGREVLAKHGAGVRGTLGPAYAAQATGLLLAAIAASDGTRADVSRRLLDARISEGPAGPMRFDRYGDPVPRHMTLYRVRGGALLPAG